jgi:threonine dehydratase
MIPYPWFEQALQRISPFIHTTPLTYDPHLDLYIKWENHQVTGSFKVRGALNKILSLQPWEQARGLVTASAGTHGQGVALAGRYSNSPVLVFASDHASPLKIAAMQALGAEVRLVQGGYAEAELSGLAYAGSSGMSWVSPYNDGLVIAGQATLAAELVEQLPSLSQNTWVIPVGGGGLFSGIGAFLENTAHRPRLVAVQSEASSFLHALYRTGTQEDVIELPSLADGLSGPVEPGSVTIPLVRKFADDFVLVSEKNIAAAIEYAWFHYHERIEGSAAVSLAAILSGQIVSRPAVLIITGGNIQPEVFDKIITSHTT